MAGRDEPDAEATGAVTGRLRSPVRDGAGKDPERQRTAARTAE